MSAEQRGIAAGESLNEFLVEVPMSIRHRDRDALLVRAPGTFDFSAEPPPEVAVLTPLANGRLVVQLDLGDEEPRVPARRLRRVLANRIGRGAFRA
jgi:hypothetical protein